MTRETDYLIQSLFEKESLEELKSLIEEEIYLIPEDREAILAQLEKNPVKSPKAQAVASESVPVKPRTRQ